MILKYSDIRGKKGVWEIWDTASHRGDGTLIASDGKESWHCYEDGRFCCKNVHRSYSYKPSNVKAQRPDGGQVVSGASRATNDKVLLLCPPSKV